ncbi:MAG: potassium channel family protein [Candidatus Saccharimonadales bacterium]
MAHIIFKYAYHLLFLLVIITIAIGTLFYHYVEDMSLVDAYYFSVVTLVTVGYGDIAPKTDFGKIFTTIYVLVGIGIVGGFISTIVSKGANRFSKKVDYHRSSDYHSDDSHSHHHHHS